MTGIALFPGAFKPPTRGHFQAVKELATNTFSQATFTKDEKGKPVPGTLSVEKKTEQVVSEVLVIISPKSRNGITSGDSLRIWNIYKKYLPENVSILESKDTDPVRTALNIVKNNPDKQYFGVVFLRSEEDFADLSRTSSFDKYENAEGLALSSSLKSVRATDLRRSVIEDDKEAFKNFIPEELSKEEVDLVFDIVKKTVKAESNLYEQLGLFVDSLFPEEVEVTEGSSGTPIKMLSTVSASDRAMLVNVYERLRNVLGDRFYNIKFNVDHITVSLKKEGDLPDFDYTPYMGSILEYMLDQNMKITPLPEVVLRKDPVQAVDFFGKTAFYEPNKKEIVLYVQGRHPKDIMRSFVHEMIHHMQNLEGKIKNITTQNVNEDDALQELEKEAYMLGNMTFRSWEDKIKRESTEKNV